jgi:outer membrane protein, multidrug efflux system
MKKVPCSKCRPKYLTLALVAFVSSCQVGPSYYPPVTPVPEQWKHSQQEVANPQIVENWWEIFNDPTLNCLEMRAIENNYNLYAALERVFQARAQACVVKADLYPQFNLNPNYTNEIILEKLFGLSNFPTIPGQKIKSIIREHQLTYALPLNLSWEVDLWGRLRSAYDSAVYNAQAQAEAFQAVLLMLTTDLAVNYFQLRTLDEQIDLYQKTIKNRQHALEINQSRYDGKIVFYEDVSRAELDLKNVQANYEEIVRQRELQEDIIAVLIGLPASEFTLEHSPIKTPPPSIPAGLPSEILMRRPDIAQSERRIASENALVRVAYASFFPSLILTGGLGFSSPDLKNFLKWKSRWWLIEASVNQTVYDAGRKCSNLELAWARFREADDDYQQQVLTAFQEVEDSLASLEQFAKEYQYLIKAVEAAKITYRISSDRYYEGVTFYLDVVDSERQELDNERTLISVLGQRYTATIQLIKALGGRWTTNPS